MSTYKVSVAVLLNMNDGDAVKALLRGMERGALKRATGIQGNLTAKNQGQQIIVQLCNKFGRKPDGNLDYEFVDAVSAAFDTSRNSVRQYVRSDARSHTPSMTTTTTTVINSESSIGNLISNESDDEKEKAETNPEPPSLLSSHLGKVCGLSAAPPTLAKSASGTESIMADTGVQMDDPVIGILTAKYLHRSFITDLAAALSDSAAATDKDSVDKSDSDAEDGSDNEYNTLFDKIVKTIFLIENYGTACDDPNMPWDEDLTASIATACEAAKIAFAMEMLSGLEAMLDSMKDNYP